MNRTSRIVAVAASILLGAAGMASVAYARHGGGGHGGGHHGGGHHGGGGGHHHGGRHHHAGSHHGHHRGHRHGFWRNGVWIDTYGYVGGGCAYEYARWMATGSGYWRDRYNACMY
jgi:hypothetical protein